MSKIFDTEFKKALQLLPDKEKDKLILRLLKKDLNLANRLYFELVSTDSVNDKRELLKEEIKLRVRRATERYYSPGYLLMDLREISGVINEHVSITKDKQGEIFLNCLMLKEAMVLNNEKIEQERPGKSYTLCIYIIARIFKLLILIQKQHEDLHLEFSEDIEELGKLLGENSNLMRVAVNNGLNINWLISFDIPENIVEIHKSLRQDGFLK